MKDKYLKELLQQVSGGDMTVEEAAEKLRSLPYEELDFAKVDNHRTLRTGYPEVVFCEGKTPEQTAEIFSALCEKSQRVMGTRASEADFAAVTEKFPGARYHKEARIIEIDRRESTDRNEPEDGAFDIAVVTAGTADIPVAEEAAVTAEIMGRTADRIYDVGVSGIHRLLDNIDRIKAADVVIAVAGMEGALASVIGGLIDNPIISVPTSVGYGSNFEGLSALLCMLNSCASGVSVVNIDNGFGAAAFAVSVLDMADKKRK
ncbi:MAG: nickel pincer cofactor biosynthesis protein LarB [Bacillota bacterium]|nr:nickel pincer cofactor biosynthesis protein LarB [Bacillota bacterium]